MTYMARPSLSPIILPEDGDSFSFKAAEWIGVAAVLILLHVYYLFPLRTCEVILRRTWLTDLQY